MPEGVLEKIESQKQLTKLKSENLLLINRIGGLADNYFDTKIGYFGNLRSFPEKQILTLKEIVTFPFSINVNANLDLDSLVKFYNSCREIQESDIIKTFDGFYFDKEFWYPISVKENSNYRFIDDLYVLQ